MPPATEIDLGTFKHDQTLCDEGRLNSLDKTTIHESPLFDGCPIVMDT
jgi:hypothetical protein